VTTVGDISLSDKLQVVKYLQDTHQYTSVLYDFTTESRKLGAVLRDTLKTGIGFLAIVAETEWKTSRTIQLKNLQTKDELEQSIQIPTLLV
jgi:hypothetical protein